MLYFMQRVTSHPLTQPNPVEANPMQDMFVYTWLAHDDTTALSGASLTAFSALLETKGADKFTAFHHARSEPARQLQ